MSMDIVKNILTLGASGRVDAAIAEYERIVANYQRAYDAMEVDREQVRIAVDRLVRAKLAAVGALRHVSETVAAIQVRERTVGAQALPEFPREDLERVNATLGAASGITHAAKGAGAGAATLTTAWALAGTVGVASTGTAISSLSGAAAFNATLAWFGGGAVASGGLGMAGGAVVLGGLTILPAVAAYGAIVHLRANKQIAEIAAEAQKVVIAIANVEQATTLLRAMEARADEVTAALNRGTAGLNSTLERVDSVLQPPGALQRLVQWFRRMFTRKTYSQKQIRAIAEVGGIAASVAKLVDQPLLTPEGGLA